jgi:hypothetical protein
MADSRWSDAQFPRCGPEAAVLGNDRKNGEMGKLIS